MSVDQRASDGQRPRPCHVGEGGLGPGTVPAQSVSGVCHDLSMDLIGESLISRYDLVEVQSAISYAKQRCRSTIALIDLACDVSTAKHYTVIRVLAERRSRLNPDERRYLKRGLTFSLSDTYRSSLSSNLRPRTDRLLSNVGGALCLEDAHSLCREALSSRLKVRRVAATKLLRRIGVDAGVLNPLRLAVVNYGDTQALKLLCWTPGGVKGMDCCNLLGLEDFTPWSDPDTYLPGLVLSRMWQDGDLDHKHASQEHPVPYLRAFGRTADMTRERVAISIIKSTNNPEALKMGASVFGRCGSVEGLKAVENRYQELCAKLATTQ